MNAIDSTASTNSGMPAPSDTTACTSPRRPVSRPVLTISRTRSSSIIGSSTGWPARLGTDEKSARGAPPRATGSSIVAARAGFPQ
jgi:hypothetical protein